MNESCHTYEWGCHIWISCIIYEWVMSHIWMSHVTHMNESFHTYEWTMSHIWISHVTHMTESCHTCMNYVTHMNEPYHRNEWVISRMNEAHHTWMRHVKYGYAMSYMNEVCHIWMRHIKYEFVVSRIWIWFPPLFTNSNGAKFTLVADDYQECLSFLYTIIVLLYEYFFPPLDPGDSTVEEFP